MGVSDVFSGTARWHVEHGDCLDVLRLLPDASVDAVVTDPPYELGFMGKAWDGQGIAYRVDLWRDVLRVLKPGGHLLAFGGTRTYHRMACAIEDSGFDVRDSLHWLYGQGFPKSHNLDGAHDGWGTALKPAHEPIVVARKPLVGTVAANVERHGTGAINVDGCRIGGAWVNRSAGQGAGHGAHNNEARKYGAGLGGVVAEAHALGRWPPNILLSHTEGCEEIGVREVRGAGSHERHNAARPASVAKGSESDHVSRGHGTGRTESAPAWRCVEGCPVRALDEQAGVRTSGASRFFPCFRYEAKASRSEREAGLCEAETQCYGKQGQGPLPQQTPRITVVRRNVHPTVKPVAVMQWLARLVTPANAVVLDPFTGSGTTGVACMREGFRFIGIEREAEYVEIARARVAAADARPRRAGVG